MSVYVFANLKGGVGKTLVTLGCAHAVAAEGGRALVIDTDAQGNASTQLTGMGPDDPPGLSLADVLDRETEAPLLDAVVPSRRPGIDVLPSGFQGLQAVQEKLFGKPGAEKSLARALRPVVDRWDYVFIDTRPGTDLMTRNAFMAADGVVVVLEPEIPAIRGGDQTMGTIEELNEYLDAGLGVAGWVINRQDRRRKDHAEYVQKIRELSEVEGVPVLGEPFPLMADISRLSVVGMGLDEHPTPTARTRNLAANFAAIVADLHAQKVASA